MGGLSAFLPFLLKWEGRREFQEDLGVRAGRGKVEGDGVGEDEEKKRKRGCER